MELLVAGTFVKRKAIRLCMLLLATSVCGGAVDMATRFDAVVRYWEWSKYWGPFGFDFPLARYQPSTVRALVFFEPSKSIWSCCYPLWGFCSKQLGVCQAYSGWGDGTIMIGASGIRMRVGETEQQAKMRFEDLGFRSDATMAAYPYEPIAVPSALRLRSLSIELRFPVLRVPAAIREKTHSSLEAELRAELARTARYGQECELIVPFADRSYPFLHVLEVCGSQKAVNTLERTEDSWIGSVGSWNSEPEHVKDYEDRIRKNAGLVLKYRIPRDRLRPR